VASCTRALVLFNFVDELTYRARSNLGRLAFKPLKKGMILVGRLVRAGDDWMVSGNPAAFLAWARDRMLATVAEYAMRNPEAVFRNPAKLAEARCFLAEHRQWFVGLFGADLIVVPGAEVPGKVEAFHRRLAQQARPDAEPPETEPVDLPDHILAAARARAPCRAEPRRGRRRRRRHLVPRGWHCATVCRNDRGVI
jgi:hypothetical protein